MAHSERIRQTIEEHKKQKEKTVESAKRVKNAKAAESKGDSRKEHKATMGGKKSKHGAGARGGVIVGYTKTGNPIYSKTSRIAGVKESKGPKKKLSAKESQRRSAGHARKEFEELPEGQRKKVANLVARKQAEKKAMHKSSPTPPAIEPASQEFKQIISVDDRSDKKRKFVCDYKDKKKTKKEQ